MGLVELRRLRRAGAACLALLPLALLCGCGGPVPPKPRLVLLYLPCTVNRHYLAPYDPGVSYTPHLERMAQEGVVFTRHQTEAGLSGIAYASILSGGTVLRHGVHTQPRRLKDSVYLIAEAFADAGYDTFHWDDHAMASSNLNYGQGVALAHSYRRSLEAGDPRFATILEKLRDDPDYRAFVMTLFSASHSPYSEENLTPFCGRHPAECAPFEGETPERRERYLELYRTEYRGLSYDHDRSVARLGLSAAELGEYARVVERLYKSRIEELDRLFGGVVAEIEDSALLDESLLVFSADHGEVLYRKNTPFKWTHGHALAPEVLGVPFLLRAPGLAPRRFEGVTRSMDVFPTVAALASLELPEQEPPFGANRAPEVLGRARPESPLAFSHTAPLHAWKHIKPARGTLLRDLYPGEDPDLIWVSVRAGDQVFKHRNRGNGRFEFVAYDLASDPEEGRDILSREDARHREMLTRVERYKAALVDSYWPSAAKVDQEIPVDRQLELLRSLGYVE